MERKAVMELSPQFLDESTPSGVMRQERRVSNLVYQGMTIAAMLLLLGSLWLF
jgi:hypothetical protein